MVRVTADGPLSPRDVAAARGVQVGTVYRYLTESRRRNRIPTLHLRPMDIPIPDVTDDPPRWNPTGPIAAWLARTADPANPAGHEPARKDTT